MKAQHKILILLLIVFAVMMQGCTGHAGSGENTTEPAVVTPVLQDLPIVSDGASEYSIIIRESAQNEVSDASRSVLNAISDATGVKLSWTDDYVENGGSIPAKEILIGVTNRQESIAVLSELKYGEYAIRIMDEKLVIAAWDDVSLAKACSVFVNQVKRYAAEGQLIIPADYSAEAVAWEALSEMPHYGSAGEIVRFVDLADNCYLLYAEDTDEAEFKAYLDVLEAAGYTQFATREMGNNLYATYVSETKVIHASYTAFNKDARIAIEDAYDMALFTKQEYEKVCEPSVTLVGQEGYMNDTEGVPNQTGLCLIFRLEDGRFIVVDGGRYVPAAGPLIRKTLRSLAVDKDNITVAAWFLTHAHDDHTGGFVHFTDDLNVHKQIKIENVIHHMVTPEQYATVNDPAQSDRVRGVLANKLADTNVIKAHTGQVFYIGGMEIEMLFTYEDLEPSPLEYMNTTSLVFRVTCRDNTVMVLGDASNRSCTYLVRSYGDYLKSDMVQISHHGYTGGTIPLYEAIDADVALWPTGVMSVDGSYEKLMARDYNAKAVELADEVYIAGMVGHTLIMPYTPAENDEAKIYT